MNKKTKNIEGSTRTEFYLLLKELIKNEDDAYVDL